jgi:hypothetical protein
MAIMTISPQITTDAVWPAHEVSMNAMANFT